jgi:hypothetical protein
MRNLLPCLSTVLLVAGGCQQPPPSRVLPPAIDAGTDAGQDAGMDAGGCSGVLGDTDCFVDAGVDAGTDAGVDAGEDAGVDAGEDAGVDAGIDGGVDAGIDGGVDAGQDAGTIELTDGGLPPGCTPETQYVFVFGEDDSLYRFYPPALSFELVGTLSCPDPQGSPNSMAVDRSGTGWLSFTDGRIFNVDTTNAACTATSYVPGQGGFWAVGMGFSSNAPGSANETLFVSSDFFRLGWIDTKTLTLTAVGSYSGIAEGNLTGRAEMTGTGDGDLYANFEGTPFSLADINKTNASAFWVQRETGVGTQNGTSNFAFSHWGPDFYLFVGAGGPTPVYRYDPVAQTTTLATIAPIEIVGAGASTCVPSK